jgi:ADP-ribosylglycohydrolase
MEVKGDAYTDKVVGSFLAALCADALGAAVEKWSAKEIRETYPDGLSAFEKCRMGRGRYTGRHYMGLLSPDSGPESKA